MELILQANLPAMYVPIFLDKLKRARDYANLYSETNNNWDRVWYRENIEFINGMLFILKLENKITQIHVDNIYNIINEMNEIYYGALK